MPVAYLTIPSARPDGGTAEKWAAAGYGVALYRDIGADPVECANIVMTGAYPGYAAACNAMIRSVLRSVPECEWCIAGGDDVLPDPAPPSKIAYECGRHFGEVLQQFRTETTSSIVISKYPNFKSESEMVEGRFYWSTFGCMQCVGDRWGSDPTHHNPAMRGAYIDRVAGSAWIGREFCERAYGGNGPLWHEYRHQFVDQELREVAIKLGVYWERPDLCQFHQHWGRTESGRPMMGGQQKMPAFLREANTPEHWRQYKALFESRKRAGFPGYEVKA